MGTNLRRSYSLLNDPAETDRYVIAVQNDAAGRGGSQFMHANVRVGQVLPISAPSNNFELVENAPQFVLFAGGIGITPILSMVHRLERIGKRWSLYYCGRERRLMAYLGWLRQRKEAGADIRFHIDAESGGAHVDIRRIVADAPAGAHFYCCGPKSMLAAFEKATADCAPQCVHIEYFAPKEEAASAGGFLVELARTKRTLHVIAGKSILETLLEANVPVGYSCMEGICGACEVNVLAGIPDHRDSVLSTEERAANNRIMVCCSGAKSPSLVLDI